MRIGCSNTPNPFYRAWLKVDDHQGVNLFDLYPLIKFRNSHVYNVLTGNHLKYPQVSHAQRKRKPEQKVTVQGATIMRIAKETGFMSQMSIYIWNNRGVEKRLWRTTTQQVDMMTGSQT